MGLYYNQTVSDFASGPPSGASTGDIWIASNVDSNGARWQFQYNAGSASAYKWEFIGGAPAVTEYGYPGGLNIGNSVTTSVTGTNFTVARAGDYFCHGNAMITTGAVNSVSTSWEQIVVLLVNGTAAVVGASGTQYFGYPYEFNEQRSPVDVVSGIGRALGCNVNDVLSIGCYSSSTGTNQCSLARLATTPIRVS